MAARPTFIVAVCIWLAAMGAACAPKSSSSDAERAPADSGSAKPATPQSASAPDSRPVIVTFGDSLTQGVSGKSYPAFLQDLLDRGGLSYRVDYLNQFPTNAGNTWQPLTNFTMTNSPFIWADTQTPNTQSRFYRAVLLP